MSSHSSLDLDRQDSGVEMDDEIRSIHDPVVRAAIYDKPKHFRFHPSPEAWEDQLMYFFLPDRFSDGNEIGYIDTNGHVVKHGSTPMFQAEDFGNAQRTQKEKVAWMDSGCDFVGGTIKGAITKLGYLKRMGVTAIWVGPVFKQVALEHTYHGYGIQNFLDVDPRFGTRKDFKDFVKAAHRQGIHVLLDIVLNHCGNVFTYGNAALPYRSKPYPVKGFWNAKRDGTIPFAPVDESKTPGAFPDAAVWPAELQTPSNFFHKGIIRRMDGDPPEISEADFFELKSLNLGAYEIDDFTPTPTLETLIECYKFWIAFLDIDGYRIDTVRHMGDGPSKYFASAIHDYAKSIGKDNFLTLAEISGDGAYEMIQRTGLDAALGIDDVQYELWGLPQGLVDPATYFARFESIDSATRHRFSNWKASQICNMIEDHDQSWRHDLKGRFCAEKNGPLMIHVAIGLNLCALGIPCLMSGTEQNFNGNSNDYIGHDFSFADRFIRESMFGGPFGAFGSRDRHFFNEDTETYKTVQAIAKIRQQEPALRRGGQVLRPISSDGRVFRIPARKNKDARLEDVVAWSRIYQGTEILCLFSTHLIQSSDVWIRVSDQTSGKMTCIYPPQQKQALDVMWSPTGHDVRVTVPPHSFMMFKS